jgi:hypothetical protein
VQRKWAQSFYAPPDAAAAESTAADAVEEPETA